MDDSASRLEETAAEYGIGVTARLPIDPVFSQKVDSGEIESLGGDWLDGLVDHIEKI
ncbi:MAG: hypothetical protein II036_00510 [Oscillospiraceae bacterium]|nr:hypothetical protein [Oscillospiraceae bacterium]